MDGKLQQSHLNQRHLMDPVTLRRQELFVTDQELKGITKCRTLMVRLSVWVLDRL